ncbi:hypothetical protein [Kistimonas asteriae]|uniref:hypothetical protein n=1 Tax=Kistimonas asteriae TaxID=517724 RepID=UPI001BAE1F30|nr:hypothetical protein [Kistimonas asteriae]
MTEPVTIKKDSNIPRSRLEQQIRDIRPLRAVNYTNNGMDVIDFFHEVGKSKDALESLFFVQSSDDESSSGLSELEARYRAEPGDWLLGVLLGYYYFTVVQDVARCTTVMSEIAQLIDTPIVCQAISDRLQVLHQGKSGQSGDLYQRQKTLLNQRLQAFIRDHGQCPSALPEVAQSKEEEPLLEELSRFWVFDPESGEVLLKEHFERHRKASERHQRMSQVVRHQPTTFEQPDNQ